MTATAVGTPAAAAALPAPAAVAGPAPVAGPPGDGRTVAIESRQALGANGDTLLGRTLARAVLADQQRSASADAVPVAPAAPAAAAPAPAPANAATEAFVRAFTIALAQRDAGASGSGFGSGDGAPAGADPLRAARPDAAPAAAPSFGLAFAQAHAAPVDRSVPVVAPAPAAQADPAGVVDQILRGMQVHTTDGQSEVRLRLTPEHLGDVSIKLVVSGGSVDASITAGSADARDALAGGQNQLARTLADAGLKLSSYTVGLAGGGFAGTRDGSNPNPWTRPGTRRTDGLGAVGADEPEDDLGLLAVPSFGPPIFSATRGFAHNYIV